MNFAALRYEELALNAFPVLHTEVYDGWILRFSDGNSLQGNCVTPLYLSTRSYEDKIDYCEEKFASRSLPSVFKMTANVSGALDQQLAMRGYELMDKTRILECPLSKDSKAADGAELPADEPSLSVPEGTRITLSRCLEDAWLDAFLSLEGMEDGLDPVSARAMLEAIREPVYCAAIYENDSIVGCGLGVVEDGKIGLYDIRVKSGHRRLGIGAAICQAILEEGRRSGADTAYLHVLAANRAAAALYEKMGFREVYTYWYRVKAQ